MRARGRRPLLGTTGVDVQKAKGLFLNWCGPRGHDDFGVRIPQRVADVVGAGNKVSVNSYHRTLGYENGQNHFNVTW